MESEYSAMSVSWSWTVCVFISGIFFGTIFIPRVLLYWEASSLQAKFRALLGPLGGDRLTSSQSRPSSDQPVYRYDVFLSFAGSNTRNTFIDHLYKHLDEKGIFTFRDDVRCETGQPLTTQLPEAIRDSRATVVVFSSNYAGSTWCLDEMADIADQHKRFGQVVIPVFYDVEPSDVRHQKGLYREAFVSLSREFGGGHFWQRRGKVHRWKTAMKYLANLSGHDIRDKRETIEMENIVQDVIDKLDHQFSADFSGLVGMQPRIEGLERLLKLNSEDEDVQVLGIWGMGGIGKTTHAMALYDRISYQFKACCFIEEVSESYRTPGGAIEVQKKILQRALKEKNLKRHSPSNISATVKYRLCNKNLPTKLLIVLDNVDELRQWNALAINPKLLGRGSRVIITTRNKHILKASGADVIYEVPLLNDNEAHELFLRKTFTNYVSTMGEDILEYAKSLPSEIKEILEYAQRLPLAITELGDKFNSLKQEFWRESFMSLQKYPVKTIMKVLRTSFEELNVNERETFLHIACFFRGKRKKYVEHILDTCGVSGPHDTIQQIKKKSLISIRNQEIHMHKMFEVLGKEIVREQYPKDPEKWNRLWHHDDFQKVLMLKKETNNVKAIVLDQERNVFEHNHLKIEGLSKMVGLEMLILHHKNCAENLNILSSKLQYLFWNGYPFSSLPLVEPYSNLVELDLPDSNIKLLWEDKKAIPSLRRVDLSNSKNLEMTPNFGGCLGVVRLDLTGCTKLTQVHESVGLLTKLDYLSLRDCSSLARLDLGTICNLSSLRVLHLSGCIKLEKTPEFTGLSNLKYLDLERCTSLSTVHESIEALARLQFLSLRGCTNLVQIPEKVSNMTSPLTLDLSGCKRLENLPLGHKVIMSNSCLESLIFLDLDFYELKRMPGAIEEALRRLERLNLARSYYSYVPDTIKKLSGLAYLNLAQCHKLEEKGMHTLIIDQDFILSEATKNAPDIASHTSMISSTSSGSSSVSSFLDRIP